MENLEFKVIGFAKSNEKYNVKMVLVGKNDLLSGTISLSTTKETKFEYGDYIKADIYRNEDEGEYQLGCVGWTQKKKKVSEKKGDETIETYDVWHKFDLAFDYDDPSYEEDDTEIFKLKVQLETTTREFEPQERFSINIYTEKKRTQMKIDAAIKKAKMEYLKNPNYDASPDLLKNVAEVIKGNRDEIEFKLNKDDPDNRVTLSVSNPEE